MPRPIYSINVMRLKHFKTAHKTDGFFFHAMHGMCLVACPWEMPHQYSGPVLHSDNVFYGLIAGMSEWKMRFIKV